MPRRRAVVPSRRRALQEDEGEDDVLAADESLTDDSGLTEDEDEEDREDEEGHTDLSDEDEDGEAELVQDIKGLVVDEKVVPPAVSADVSTTKELVRSNGADGASKSPEDAGAAENGAGGQADVSGAGKQGVHKQPEETPLQRRRREHEAYKKQRDADPAFVPNRGRFFMHDHRHGRGGSNGFRPFGRGFIRRGGMPGPGFNRYDQRGHCGCRRANFDERDSREPPSPATDRWKHDMHEDALKDEKEPAHEAVSFQPPKPREQPADIVRSFGRTHLKGTVQIIVNLPGMKTPITFSEVPYRVYTKLPNHRPPLRRDKPVRIALADAPIRYIYPSLHRSFVFIPRNMRPNQQHTIARGGFGPRPRSFVGGIQRPMNLANQTPAMSRRSSTFVERAQDADAATTIALPAESQAQVAPSNGAADIHENDKTPVVKLPPSATEDLSNAPIIQEQTDSGDKPSVTVKLPPVSSYPTPPAQPIQAVRPTSTIPMHQPRPQKAVSMADIENPASLPPDYPHGGPDSLTQTRNPSFIQNAEAPPPLPESAVHAQPFQPSYVYHPPYFFPGHMMSPVPPPMDAYGNPHDPRSFGGMPPPPFGSPFNVSAPPFVPIPASAPPATTGNAIAQESNGTVYFYEPSHYYAAYGAPYPMIGMPMPMTPAPDGMPPPPGAEGMGVDGSGATAMNGMFYYHPPPVPVQGQPIYYGP